MDLCYEIIMRLLIIMDLFYEIVMILLMMTTFIVLLSSALNYTVFFTCLNCTLLILFPILFKI